MISFSALLARSEKQVLVHLLFLFISIEGSVNYKKNALCFCARRQEQYIEKVCTKVLKYSAYPPACKENDIFCLAAPAHKTDLRLDAVNSKAKCCNSGYCANKILGRIRSFFIIFVVFSLTRN